MPFIPALGKNRIEGHCKFKVGLVYLANSRQPGLYSESLLSSNTERMSLSITPVYLGKQKRLLTAQLLYTARASSKFLLSAAPRTLPMATHYSMLFILFKSDHLPHNSYQLLWFSAIKHK